MNFKNIFTQVTSTMATAVVLSTAIAFEAPKAEAASYKLSWEGNGGYTAMGMFSFSDDLLGGIVTKEELDDLMVSFFNPEGTLLTAFDYDFPNPDTSGEFNFNFDTVTKTIIQSGVFGDEDFGLDLGIDFDGGETGLDFYTDETDGSVGIILDEISIPGAEPGDEGYELIDEGGVLTATKVPEPASIFGLFVIGTLGAGLTRQKKQAK